MTKAQVIELERSVIDFMLDHFASKPFLNALLNMKTTQIRAMQPIYFSLFKRTLAYAQQCANKAVRSRSSFFLEESQPTDRTAERAQGQEGQEGKSASRTVDQPDTGLIRSNPNA